MNKNLSWQAFYRSAVLELCPEFLLQRIEEAERAIHQRTAELRRGDSSSEEERQALDDALRMLRLMARTEGRSPQAMPSRIAEGSKGAL